MSDSQSQRTKQELDYQTCSTHAPSLIINNFQFSINKSKILLACMAEYMYTTDINIFNVIKNNFNI